MTWLAAYSFDDVGTSTITDQTGNGWDIDLTGQPGAQVDSAGALDAGALGKTGAGLIPLPAGLQAAFEVDDRTVMFDTLGLRAVWWVRASSDSFGTGVFGLLSLDAATVISRARTQTNVGPSSTITLGALSASVRHNFCMTYQRSTGVLTGYYDGALAGTATFTPGTAIYVGADDFDMAEWSSTGPSIDNLRFADHCADATEVAALAGTPVTGITDVAGTAAGTGGGTGTATGVREVVATQTGAGGGAGSATGTAEHVGTAAGAGGGIGTATGEQQTVPRASGAGGGAGSATGIREVVGTMTGAGGGWGTVIVVSSTPTPGTSTGGWGSALSILHRQRVAATVLEPITACPHDGEPLATGPDGTQFCPWDGWTP